MEKKKKKRKKKEKKLCHVICRFNRFSDPFSSTAVKIEIQN